MAISSLPGTLRILRRRAAALARFHESGSVHGFITPTAFNSTENGDETLDRPANGVPNRSVEQLRYSSPEQAGRLTNIDHRSDLYSFGLTAFEMFAGRPPFEHTELVQLIHAHLTIQPPNLRDLCPEIPEQLSDTIAKLIAKAPNDRYGSAASIEADLRRIETEFTALGTVEPFELDQAGHSSQFHFGNHLYGRETVSQELDYIYGEAICGNATAVMVAGYSGIGKSALIGHLIATARESGSITIEGKFDQRGGDIPYAAVTKALGGLLEKVLSSDAEELREHRSRLVEELDEYLPVLVEFVPDLAHLVGAQPSSQALSPAGARRRLTLAFSSLLEQFAKPDRPLVLFLDDLQWIDDASLELLSASMQQCSPGKVLFAGAYRDNEVGGDHPTALFLNDMARVLGSGITLIQLGNLGIQDTQRLITDAFTDVQASAELAELLVDLTDGNPFYAKQLLRSMVSARQLYYDPSLQHWNWKVDDRGAIAAAENVVELMTTRLALMGPDAQDALRIGATIGAAFSIDLISAVSKETTVETLLALAPAIQDGLISGTEIEGRPGFQFAHDRVQQAAMVSRGHAADAVLHLTIADAIVEVLGEEGNVFDIVDHLNLASHAIYKSRDPIDAAGKNLRAGLAAMTSLAYESATRYFDAGIAFLPDDAWSRAHSIAFDLHLHAIEAAALRDDPETFNLRLEQLRPNADTTVERLRMCVPETMYLAQSNQMREAVDAGMRGLTETTLFEVPKADSDHVHAFREQVNRFIGSFDGLDIESQVLGRTEATDPEFVLVLQIISAMGDAAFYVNRELLQLLAATAANLSLELGNSVMTSSMYAFMGQGMIRDLAMFPESKAVAQAALRLAADDDRSIPRTFTPTLWFIFHWYYPLLDSIPIAEQTIDAANRVHDPLFGTYALNVNAFAHFFMGTSMSEVVADQARISKLCEQFGMSVPAAMSEPMAMAARSLMRPGIAKFDDLSLVGFDVEAFADSFAHVPMTIGLLRGTQGVLYGLARKHRDVIRVAEDPGFSGCPPLICDVPLVFWKGIAYASLALQEPERRKQHLDDLAFCIKSLDDIADFGCAENVAHRALFLKAEQKRVSGVGDPARDMRNAALLAGANGFYLEVGYILEREAELATERDDPPLAIRSSLEHAKAAYLTAGAKALVGRVETAIGRLFQEENEDHIESFDQVDIEAILSAVRALTSKLDSDRLLNQLLTITMASAGADRGAIVRRSEANINVEASEPQSTDRSIPLGATRYVLNSAVPVILNDLTKLDSQATAHRFGDTHYLERNGVAGLVVLPIGQAGATNRALVLEYSRPTTDLSNSRVQVMEWLALQAAISLDNAEMYELLEARVQQRTIELTQLNEALRLNQVELEAATTAAEQSSRAKTTFVANMSHEVRTPMTAILASTGHLIDSSLDDFQRQHLNVLDQSAHLLLTMIEDILDLSKVEQDRLVLEEVEFDLRALIDHVVLMSRDVAKAAGLEVGVEVDNSVPTALIGDPLRLSQVILNLVSNSVRFTKSGSICIATKWDSSVAGLTLIISDTGIGMDSKALATVFEPFAQADVSTARCYGGTGLGLTICARLVELMDGTITLSSTPGEGTVATVVIPARVGQGRPDESTPRISVSALGRRARDLRVMPEQRDLLASIHALIVEDDPAVRELTSSMLGRMGATVTVAGDGESALRALSSNTIDVALVDCQMAGMDGYELTRLIRQNDQLSAIPIIALTASTNDADRARGAIAGMNIYLTKPASPEVIYEAIHSLVREGASPPAIDWSLTSGHAANSQDLLQGLRLMRDQYRQSPADLAAALETNDSQTLDHILHSMKGASATFGATSLQRKVEKFQNGVANNACGDELKDHLRELSEAWDQLVEQIDSLT